MSVTRHQAPVTRSYFEATPAVWCGRRRSMCHFWLLYSRGKYNVDHRDMNSDSALYWASFYGYSPIVKTLLLHPKITVEAASPNIRGPLHGPCILGYWKILKYLLGGEDRP